jgi:hypothetical protein
MTHFIALMMELVRTSETSVYFNETTRRYIPKSVVFRTQINRNTIQRQLVNPDLQLPTLNTPSPNL